MSDFKLKCPHCQQSLEAPEEMLGAVVDCPSCNGRIQLPVPPARPKAPATGVSGLPTEPGSIRTRRIAVDLLERWHQRLNTLTSERVKHARASGENIGDDFLQEATDVKASCLAEVWREYKMTKEEAEEVLACANKNAGQWTSWRLGFGKLPDCFKNLEAPWWQRLFGGKIPTTKTAASRPGNAEVTEVVVHGSSGPFDVRQSAKLPSGRSRCPKCQHEFDRATNTIAPPEKKPQKDDDEATAQIFTKMIGDFLESAGQTMPHVRCPKCGTTWMETR
jgi:DNA-directed RNA polymerase subunit RPC12/RpoP